MFIYYFLDNAVYWSRFHKVIYIYVCVCFYFILCIYKCLSVDLFVIVVLVLVIVVVEVVVLEMEFTAATSIIAELIYVDIFICWNKF